MHYCGVVCLFGLYYHADKQSDKQEIVIVQACLRFYSADCAGEWCLKISGLSRSDLGCTDICNREGIRTVAANHKERGESVNGKEQNP